MMFQISFQYPACDKTIKGVLLRSLIELINCKPQQSWMYDYLNVVRDRFEFIPAEAFLYQPTSKNNDIENQATESLQTDDYIIKTKDNEIKRLIFQGNTKFTRYENGKLREFEQYLERKKITIDQRWDRSWKLRWLQSTGYDNKKTVQDMQKYVEYLDKNKQVALLSNVQKYLKAGIYYLAGRDFKYRPILILDVKKIIQLKLTEEQMYQCEVYFFQFIIRNFLIPGRVEMWITIIDVGYEGVMSMIGPMKSSISFLQSTFRSRMYVAYIIRPSSACSFLWSIAQKFLQEDTKRKVVFVDGQVMTALLEYCNSTQLEKKFGGSAYVQPNTYWPPRIFSPFYESKIKTMMLTEEQYRKKYQRKELQNTKVYEPYIRASIGQSKEFGDLKLESMIKEKAQIRNEETLWNVEAKFEIRKSKINLIAADKKIIESLEKLKEKDITFLAQLNLESKNLSPISGFDWLLEQTGSNDTLAYTP